MVKKNGRDPRIARSVPQVVSLNVSRDESTFLLNLVDKELERLLLLTNHHGTSNMSVGEGNGVYQDKSMCYRLAVLLEESVRD